jgi:DNA-binding transcriptional LysR family regulator
MRFTFRQLEYFIAAGESGSIKLATHRANISEPSISTAIAQLERELGVQLFIRHHAEGLSLTPAGRIILRDAKQLIRLAKGLYSAAIEFNQAVRGELSIGCFVTLAPMVMPELAYSFSKEFVDTQVQFREHHQEGLLQGLRRAEIEVAITYDLGLGDDIAFEPLATLRPYALFAANNPLRHRTSVSLQDLAEQPMILLELPLSREYFLALFAAEGLQPKVVWRTDQNEIVRTMVANGHGFTLANVRPRADVALDGRRLYGVRLTGNPRSLSIGLATLKGLGKSRLLGVFEEHCRRVVTDQYIPGMKPAVEGRVRRSPPSGP